MIGLISPVTLAVTICSSTFFVIFIVTAAVQKQKARIFRCPNCFNKVSRDYITLEKISCEYCEWELIPVEDLTDQMQLDSVQLILDDELCSRCSGTLEGSEFAQLWDNRFYCKTCITERSEELWEYVNVEEMICEEVPYTLWSIFRRTFLLLDLGMLALFGTLAFIAGILEGGFITGLIFVFWFHLGTLPLVLVFAGVATMGFAMRRPEVTVLNNKLTVRQGNFKSATKPLAEFEWFAGNATKSNISNTMMPSSSAVLLVLPREKAKHEEYVAVGYSDHMREIWKAFLTLAEVPHRSDWDREVRDWSGIWSMLAAILVIPVTFASGCGVALGLSLLISFLSGNDGLALLIGVQPLMPGTIFAFAYVSLILTAIGGSPNKTKNSTTERKLNERKMFRTYFFLSLFILAMTIGYPVIVVSVFMRVTVLVISIPFWFYVSRDLAKRYSAKT